ncbi:carbonic anhydrase [Mycobacterium antarcticum]|uniref:carbonic anhydrase n=1 Tax=Mycolicibacterium sp. TUM20983 TaxID=3023369 RepID=UPI0023933249|nr:carbonic anhydrase [Mycolicibacterium sp. TUM20983]GLP76609.1 carbonic anhydrase [Mycolicibacterium sp. TUM20983]
MAAVFACADARVSAETVFDQHGTLVTVSTWGHVLGPAVIGSIEYAVARWGVPLVVVLGHDECAALRVAADHGEEAACSEGFLGLMVRQLSSTAAVGRRGLIDTDDLAARHVVATGSALIAGSSLLARRIRQNRCALVCATTAAAAADGQVRLHLVLGNVEEVADARDDA